MKYLRLCHFTLSNLRTDEVGYLLLDNILACVVVFLALFVLGVVYPVFLIGVS